MTAFYPNPTYEKYQKIIVVGDDDRYPYRRSQY